MIPVQVAFVSSSRRRAATRAAAPRRYPAQVARQLALAHALRGRVSRGEFADYAAMARDLGFTRARISQLMDLLLLAPDIQEELLFLEALPGQQPLTERTLRDVVLRSLDWEEQRRLWGALRPPIERCDEDATSSSDERGP